MLEGVCGPATWPCCNRTNDLEGSSWEKVYGMKKHMSFSKGNSSNNDEAEILAPYSYYKSQGLVSAVT